MGARDMVARNSDYEETRDFIPTPPWATRVLYEYVAPELKHQCSVLSAWDPACGQGHMLKVFDEYHHPIIMGSDIEAYPSVFKNNHRAKYVNWVLDFTKNDIDTPPDMADVIITNPPYKKLYEFVDLALARAHFGVGMLVRVQALESEQRYNDLYTSRPPTQIAFFSNRIPFKSGKVVQKAPKMFFHVWLWWEKHPDGRLKDPRPPIWVPYDAQKYMEKGSDYAE